MNRLIDRPLGYKVGLVLYFVGLLLFLLGFSIPAWHTYTVSKLKYNDGYKNDDIEVIVTRSGLWLTCLDGLTDCDYYDVIPGWLNGVRFCMSMSFLLIGIALLCAILLNFTDVLDVKNEIKKRTFELFCFIGVIFGLIGFIVYATSVKSGTGNHISWAYAICCIGEIMILASGLIVTVTHPKTEDNKTTSVSQWPYGMGTGLDSSFQQETQISGFPEIDNPAFTDPSQIRFTRTTATAARPPSIHSSQQTLTIGPDTLARAHPIQQPEPSRATRFQKKTERDRYSWNDSRNTSTGQESDFIDAPPSYQSVISESSGRSGPQDQDLGDGQPYYNYNKNINNEVTL